MSKYLLLSDIHLSDKPPSSCTESYTDDLFSLLEQTVKVARRRKVVAVVWAGDVFHVKTPSRTSHELVNRTKDLIDTYPCPVFIVPGNHDLCVSADTEALTNRGWRRRDQMDGTELFATLNPQTHELEWQAPTRMHVSSFFGELVHFKGDRVDHLVTPNHELYVTPMRGPSIHPRVQFTPEAPPRAQRWYSLMAAPQWEGKSQGSVQIPPSARAPGFNIPEEDAARLFGWYVSEGSCEPWRVVISQSQTASYANYEEISALVQRLGFKPHRAAKTIRIGSAPLAEFLAREFGRVSGEKHLPEWVKNWPRNLLALVLDTAIKGDGTANGRSSWTYTSNSEQLIDDFQEVCVRLGIRSVKSGPIPTRHRDYPGSPGTMFRLVISPVTLTSLPAPRRVQYAGEVWCPELPNGLWFSRRNGRVICTGNSHDRLESIDSQPLGALFRRHALRLEGWGGYDAHTQYMVYGVPWLQGYGDWGAYDGDDPHPPIEMNLSRALRGYREQVRERGTGSRKALVVAHAPLYPPGQELQYEYFPASRWAEAMGGGPGWVFYGHVHPWHGVYHAYSSEGTIEHVTFCNHGALSRGSLHESELTRQVGCTLWDDATGEFEFVPLDAKPADQVFRLAEKQQVTDMQGRLDEFLESVGAATLEAVSMESVIAHIRTLGLGREAEDLAADLITEAAHGGKG